MARQRSLHASASGLEMRRWTCSTPPSNTRYSAHVPGKSFTAATSTHGTSPVAAKRRGRVRGGGAAQEPQKAGGRAPPAPRRPGAAGGVPEKDLGPGFVGGAPRGGGA